SLERGLRESAEDQFDSARDAILVATSTLEVGVDIGDVDAVLLVGPPTDTNALLQRVGRAGRRSGVTKIIAIAKSLMDRAAIGSMLVSARDGRFDSLPYGMRWSVAVQQISSFVKQGTSQGRRIDDLLDLAEKVVPNGGRGKARSIIDHLLVEGCLESTKHQRVVFGEPWTELWEGMGMHGNIDSGGHGVPVVDSVTGDTIAHIPHKAGLTERVSIGGSDWKVIKSDGEILLEPDKKSKGSDGVRYGSRKAPVGRNFARHVARGYGLDECETPLVTFRGRNFMFHFGGSAYEKMLMNLHHGFERANGLSGIAVCGDFGPSVLAEILETKSFTSIVDSRLDELATVLMPGPYHRMLPDGIRHHTLSELFGPEEFKCWLGSRVLRRVERDDPLHSELVQALEETFID
ncbi:hypothetical protein FJY94_07780, partial [Candidatus Kaiserbacteria bacterium]|nr:hypothetical protein [Candidatus Kaiserbacteria bacterium]